MGIKPDDINRLNVIHIAGTKGKGSTCAFVESILRANGYKTGFYSSPHLVVVRERIRLNGRPISEELFTKYFDHVYNEVEIAAAKNIFSWPGYFNFLTLMAFYIFVKEKVDVAILEVGIGGEQDCTNVVEKPIVTGVTTLDYDHCKLLGNTLEEIAAQKAGIFKPGVPALSVPQTKGALEVLIEKAQTVNAPFFLVPSWSEYSKGKSVNFGIKGDAQKINASLAIQMVNFWLTKMRTNNYQYKINDDQYQLDSISLGNDNFILGLNKTIWHGRCQTIQIGSITYFLDAAHTQHSMFNCQNWFVQQTLKSNNFEEKILRILVFNCTGNRDPEPLLKQLININFDYALFTTNRVELEKKLCSDSSNFTVNGEIEAEIRLNNYNTWKKLNIDKRTNMLEVNCIHETISLIDSIAQSVKFPVHVLICGSVHLVGGFISLLWPDYIEKYC